jgi:hypothetical protein
MNPGHTISGHIAYLSLDGRETGRERFDLSSQHGGFVLRAFCEMDDVALTRDVTLAMDRDWRPLDAFCRITRHGHREAAMWFDVSETAVCLHSRIGTLPSASTSLPLDLPLDYLGLHPLQGDALIVNRRGTDKPGEYVPIASVTNSISPNGDEAVGARKLAIEVAYLGEESIDVAAGKFAARHYALRWDPAWPPADLWVRQQDCIFLAMRWAHVPTRYELTALTEDKPA